MKIRIHKKRYFKPTFFGNFKETWSEEVLEYRHIDQIGSYTQEQWFEVPIKETLIGL